MSRSITTAALTATSTAVLAATLTLLLAATLAVRPAQAQSSEAENLYVGFDLGANKIKFDTKFSGVPDSKFVKSSVVYGLHVGYRRDDAPVGFELSYARTTKEDQNNKIVLTTPALRTEFNVILDEIFGANASDDNRDAVPTDGNVLNLRAEVSSSIVGADIIGYFPLDEKVDALAIIGLASTTIKAKVNLKVDTSSDDDTAVDGTAASRTIKLDGIGLRVGFGAQFAINEQFNVRGLVRYSKPGDDLKYAIKSITSLEVGMNLLF